MVTNSYPVIMLPRSGSKKAGKKRNKKTLIWQAEIVNRRTPKPAAPNLKRRTTFLASETDRQVKDNIYSKYNSFLGRGTSTEGRSTQSEQPRKGRANCSWHHTYVSQRHHQLRKLSDGFQEFVIKFIIMIKSIDLAKTKVQIFIFRNTFYLPHN